MTIWQEEFAAIPEAAIALWNQNVIPWMHERGDEYKKVAHAEAKRRGYLFDADAHAYVQPWKMEATRGHNLIAVGYKNGTLRCAFAKKKGFSFYLYPGVPEAEFEKLKKSPFPDKLFVTNIKNKGYQAEQEAA